MIRPTLIPPTLVRDLPEPLWPLWQVMSPQFSYETGTISFLAKEPNIQQNLRESAAHTATKGLGHIAAARQQGAIQPFKLNLIEAGARLKLGQVQIAQSLLAEVACDSDFISSLKAPAAHLTYPLMNQHPLWLVAHIAVEMGNAVQLLPQLLSMGLRARSALEPEIASGLLTNALCSGAWDTFDALIKENWRLGETDKRELNAFLAQLHGQLAKAPADTFVYDEQLVLGLSPLCRACERLGVSVDMLSVFEQRIGGKQKKRWRQAFISLSPTANQHKVQKGLEVPRRTTGIQIRQTIEEK